MKITIITPTYNREYKLSKLYESLKHQTSKDFEWLVVDDGSTDNTKKLIEKYNKEGLINIRYIFQNNGGKHRALNTGINTIKNEMTFIVDSDDYLREDAVEVIQQYHKKYKNYENVCGFSFLRCFPNGQINGMKFKQNEYISNYIDCRLNEKIEGDKAEVYYTKCLKEYPFLEVENEKFLFEDYVWIQMAEKYDTVHINEAIYIGEYLSDGLTKNIDKKKVSSPLGMVERGKVMCSKKANLKNKAKGAIIYIAYSKIAKLPMKLQFKKFENKFLFVLVYLFAVIFKNNILARTGEK